MKRVVSSVSITAAEKLGTTLYEVTRDQLEAFYRDQDNMVATYLVDNYGFEAFDIEHMYGSAIIDDTLYICDTDGDYVIVDDVDVNPETLLEDYDLSQLTEFLRPADEQVLKRYVSLYEMIVPKGLSLDDIALELLNAGHHFTTIVEDANQLDFLGDIL